MKRKKHTGQRKWIIQAAAQTTYRTEKYIVCDHLTKKLDSSQSMRAFTTLVLLSCRVDRKFRPFSFMRHMKFRFVVLHRYHGGYFWQIDLAQLAIWPARSIIYIFQPNSWKGFKAVNNTTISSIHKYRKRNSKVPPGFKYLGLKAWPLLQIVQHVCS